MSALPLIQERGTDDGGGALLDRYLPVLCKELGAGLCAALIRQLGPPGSPR